MPQLNGARGNGFAFSFGFTAHIDHVCIAFLVKVRKSVHCINPLLTDCPNFIGAGRIACQAFT